MISKAGMPVWLGLMLLCAGCVQNIDLKLTVVEESVAPVIARGCPGTEDNKSGFETGQVVLLDGVYHMFVNEMFGRHHWHMRVSHWTSPDGLEWKRQSTVMNSILPRAHNNPRSEVWCTGVRFSEKSHRWNIFYIAYRSGDEEKGENWGSDYDGKVWMAESVAAGKGGIAGPYRDVHILMEQIADAQEWEGQQAVASFHPYLVADRWYAFFCGHNHIPSTDWLCGLATADSLEGEWTRCHELNPSRIDDYFAENPVVLQWKDKGYLAVYDIAYRGKNNEMILSHDSVGYSFSKDGIHWPPGKSLKVQSEDHNWAKDIRTPLGVVPYGEDRFMVMYTAEMKKEPFWAVGRVIVKIEEVSMTKRQRYLNALNNKKTTLKIVNNNF